MQPSSGLARSSTGPALGPYLRVHAGERGGENDRIVAVMPAGSHPQYRRYHRSIASPARRGSNHRELVGAERTRSAGFMLIPARVTRLHGSFLKGRRGVAEFRNRCQMSNAGSEVFVKTVMSVSAKRASAKLVCAALVM